MSLAVFPVIVPDDRRGIILTEDRKGHKDWTEVGFDLAIQEGERTDAE